MGYQVLARKYRPQQFSDVVGQAHVTDTLRNAITASRVAHAYLFVGPRGIGKTSIARILAKALNCASGPTPTPCDVCDSCKEIMASRSMDVLEFDAASTTQVDKIREIIIDRVAYAPARGPLKVYIVDEVHMLSTSSFNALLKTLEEPPAHVKFIFATTDPQKVPATIASRCQRFDLRRIARADIMRHLRMIADKEDADISEDALLAIARGAEGGLRDAESALDQLIAFESGRIEEHHVLAVFGLAARRELEGLAAAVTSGDIPDLLRRIGALDAQGKALPRLVIELLEFFRDLLVVQQAPDQAALDLPEPHREALARHAAGVEAPRLLRIIDLLSGAEAGIRHALSQRTMLEVALIRCARIARTVSLDEILRHMQLFREGLTPPPPPQAVRETSASQGPATPAAPAAAPPPALAPGNARPDESTPPPTPAHGNARPDGPAPPDTGRDRDHLNAQWRQVVEEVAGALPRLRSGLFDARVLRVEDTRVDIGVDPEFAKEIALLEEPRSARAIGRALSRKLGRRVVARFEPLPPGVPAASDHAVEPETTRPAMEPNEDARPSSDTKTPTPERTASVHKRLLEDPGVRKALDLFEGTIVELRG